MTLQIHPPQDGSENSYSETEFHPNGRPSCQAHYVDGLLDGVYQSWHEDGSQASRISYVKGKKHGLAQSLAKDGKVLSRYFENGMEIDMPALEEAGLGETDLVKTGLISQIKQNFDAGAGNPGSNALKPQSHKP